MVHRIVNFTDSFNGHQDVQHSFTNSVAKTSNRKDFGSFGDFDPWLIVS